ncbi:MAG: dTDP-4-dehydrorhamnose reductase [Mobilitalea sp.]
MKRIMFTGAAGQLGLALYHLLNDQEEYELLRTDAVASADGLIKSLDITDEVAVTAYIEKEKPEIIINCAAITAVDLCEVEQEKAYRINALGPKYLAISAAKVDAKLIHISTDYVFDGQGFVPLSEDAIPNPTSVYGKTKNAGDEFVKEYCSKYFILRTAWVYGEGKNFVKTMLALAEKNTKVRVVSDQFGTPTSALELARVIIYLMETESFGVYHATCEGSASWYDFAVTIFEAAGKKVEVEAISTADYPTPAARPMYSVLDNKALRERHGYYMKDWKEAFKEYMEEYLKL